MQRFLRAKPSTNIGFYSTGLCGRRVVRICTFADTRTRPEEIWFRADGILDFRRLGILPRVASTSHVASHRIFLSWVC